MTKEEKYQTIVPQIQALMAGETDEIDRMYLEQLSHDLI